MLKNLRAEMVRHEINTSDISSVIKKSERTARLKVAGTNAFTMPEALAIRDSFFPDMSLEYLFEISGNGSSA